MSNELEPVIRRIENRAQARPGRVTVAINQKTGKAVPEAGLLDFLLKDLVLYEFTVDEPVWLDNARAAIAVFLTNERSDLKFRIRVKVRREAATAAAEALHDRELTPSQVLFKTVRDYLGGLLEHSAKHGPESVIERIALNGTSWQAEIERVIASRLHLDAEIIFEMPRPIIDTDVIVRADGISVSPKDALHASFPITVSVILERAQSRVNDPLPRSEEDRQSLVRGVVTKAFRDGLSLYAYWFQPDEVKNELVRALVAVLARYAYTLKSLTIDPIEPPVAAEQQIVDDVSWTGRLGRPIPFHIETRVRMTSTGAGNYHARKLPNRKEWIKAEVHAALQSAMHGRDFIDLTAEAEREVHNTVHQRLNERARTIGHDVDTFVASAAIPEQIWLKPVTVAVERREYKTKNDLVPAEFEIDLVVELTTLARLERLIQMHMQERPNDIKDGANDAIRAAIAESASRAAARFMSQIEPADYFSKYERWEIPIDDVQETGQQNYVRSRLIQAIRNELKADFNIGLCRINPRRVDSRVTAIIKFVHQIGDVEIEVEVEPRGSAGPHDALKIKMVYFIGSVAPDQLANVIQRGEVPIREEDLRRSLRNWSREELFDRPIDELYSLRSQSPTNLIVRGAVEKNVAQQASYHFGIVIGIKSVDCEFTERDSVGRDSRALGVKQQRSVLTRIQRGIEELGAESDDEAHRKYLRSRQTVLRNMITSNPREVSEDFERLSQNQEELDRIDRDLKSANKGIVTSSLSQLEALSGPRKQAEEEPDEAVPEDVNRPRNTSL